MQTFFKVCKLHANFWAHSAVTNLQNSKVCQSANHKFANFYDRKFLQNTANLCLRTVLKVVFLNDLILWINFSLSIKYYISKEKKCAFAEGSQNANLKSNKLLKSANWRICNLGNLFADHLPLLNHLQFLFLPVFSWAYSLLTFFAFFDSGLITIGSFCLLVSRITMTLLVYLMTMPSYALLLPCAQVPSPDVTSPAATVPVMSV